MKTIKLENILMKYKLDKINISESIELINKVTNELIQERKLISEWINETQDIPTNVYKALTNDSVYYRNREYFSMVYMDEVNKINFLRCRNVGKKAWNDFQILLNNPNN